MSAGVCGKRLGFEEIFGSSSPTSAKRSRCSYFGSPNRSPDIGFGTEDKVSFLLRMFPRMNPDLIETVLRNHQDKIEDTIESLQSLCLGDVLREGTTLPSSDHITNGSGENVQDCQSSVQKVFNSQEASPPLNPNDGSSWANALVQEMMNASDVNDAHIRAIKILESFEISIVSHMRAVKEQEIESLKQKISCLLNENQILKRAVSIQHDKNSNYEEKLKEMQQLKIMISQFQEQIRALEVSNYTLKLHLQRAQNSNPIPGHFHPDIF